MCRGALSRPLPDPAVFLEVFAGTHRLASTIARKNGWPVLFWDIQLGPAYDLTVRLNQYKIVGWLRAGRLRGLHHGNPCRTFSPSWDSRPGLAPLRSDFFPLGLPDLQPGDGQKVQIDNILMRFTAQCMRLCLVFHVPMTAENPRSSRLWQCPPIRYLLRRRRVQLHHTDYCSFGVGWKRSVSFAAVWVSLDKLDCRRCHGSKRCCMFTGRPHWPLLGQAPNGRFWAAIGEPYPPKLCELIASCFSDWECSVVAGNFSKYV